MIDETNRPEDRAEASASSAGATRDRVGFCQECGRPLTQDTLRRVGNGVFCDPCATARQATATGAQGWQAVNPGAYSATTAAGTASGSSFAEPNPMLAGVLGFIPGVGAMYNGQYAKGALHLIVFVVLVALADNLNWVMWWLVWGWIFYQVFEAYHTARARRDHLPLPNPFGWNDLGDRLGFGKNWPGAMGTPAAAGPSRPASAGWTGYVPPTPPPAAAYTPPVAPVSDNPYFDPLPPVPPPQASATAAPGTSVPYTQTFTGPAPSQVAGVPDTGLASRFPVGALWLIGLGILFLIGNLLPEWRLSGRWLVPVLLGMLAVWGAIRRLENLRVAPMLSGLRPSVVGALIGPSVLLTVAILLGLQNAGTLPMSRSWPILLVVWGAMLLTQRATDPLLQTGSVAQASTPVPPAPTAGTGPLGL